MDAFDIIVGPAGQMDRVALRPFGAGELIGPLRIKITCACRRNPLPARGPTRFLRNQVFVGRLVVGAQEQVGVVVRAHKKHVVPRHRRNKQGAQSFREVVRHIDRRLDRRQVIHRRRRIGEAWIFEVSADMPGVELSFDTRPEHQVSDRHDGN